MLKKEKEKAQSQSKQLRKSDVIPKEEITTPFDLASLSGQRKFSPYISFLPSLTFPLAAPSIFIPISFRYSSD